MISPHRIAEILAQCKRDELLMAEGENSVYENFFMDLQDDVSRDKAKIYIDSEISRLEKVKDESSYEKWQKARGGITGLNKLREAIDRYGD